MPAYARARDLIDAAHAADPARAADGRPAELVYAERVEAWVVRLIPATPPLLRLAARCQHLERWSVPRASFPEGKVAYLNWRKSLYAKQAARAKELLLAAGVSAAEADEAATWVSKTGLKTNPGTQALEDAAVLGSWKTRSAPSPRSTRNIPAKNSSISSKKPGANSAPGRRRWPRAWPCPRASPPWFRKRLPSPDLPAAVRQVQAALSVAEWANWANLGESRSQSFLPRITRIPRMNQATDMAGLIRVLRVIRGKRNGLNSLIQVINFMNFRTFPWSSNPS